MSDAYYDPASGTWRSEEGTELGTGNPEHEGAIDEARTEDDVQADQVDVEDADADPMDDPDFREAARGHSELSGKVVSHGRRRGNHPTGFKGRGLRGLRYSDSPPRHPIRPTGRQLGPGAPATGRHAMADPTSALRSLLGKRRVELLQTALMRPGNPREAELEARAYLGVTLLMLDDTTANRAAAELLLGAFVDDHDRERKLRKIGDLRRRARWDDPKAYPWAVLARAELDLEARLGQMVTRRRRRRRR